MVFSGIPAVPNTSLGQAKIKVRSLNFKKAKFQPFKGLVNRIP